MSAPDHAPRLSRKFCLHPKGRPHMSVRHACPQALPSGRPAMAARHVGRCPGLVDEHQPLGIEIELTLEPSPAPLYDVRPVLLARMGALFLRVIRWRTKNRHNVVMLVLTP